MSSIAEATGAGGHMRWVILRDLGFHSPAGSLNPPLHPTAWTHLYAVLSYYGNIFGGDGLNNEHVLSLRQRGQMSKILGRPHSPDTSNGGLMAGGESFT